MVGGRAGRHLGASILTMIVLSTAGLAACTDDATPPPQSSTTAPSPTLGSTPPSASPTATPPSAPKAEPTPKSAEAFVKYFWEVYNYSYATLDSTPLQEISKSTCRFCSGSVTEIDETKNRGLRNRGGQLNPRVIAAPPGRVGNFIVVSSIVNQEAGQVIGPDQQVLSTSKALVNVKAKTRLEWESGAWIVAATNISQNES